MAHQPFALVAGAGPGLGQALMRRFIANGMTVVGLSRSGATDSDLDIRACDLTDANAVRSVIAGLISAYGTPKIVVHNPAHLVIRPFLELTESDFIDSWRAMTLRAVLLGQSTLQPMVRVVVVLSWYQGQPPACAAAQILPHSLPLNSL